MKTINTEIRYLKGVGPKKAEILAKLGINSIEDLLLYLPRRYEDRSIITPIRQVKIGEFQSIKGKISKISLFTTKIKSKSVFQMQVADQTGSIYVVWYNMPFLKKNFVEGQEVVFYGRIDRYDKVQMVHPDYEKIELIQKNSLNTGRIVPVYPLTAEISQKYIRNIIDKAITEYLFSIKEILPENVIEKRDLLHCQTAIKNIHFTTSFDMLTKAYRRIVFEEFLLLQMALAKKKAGNEKGKQGLSHKKEHDLLDKFKKLLPFELTEEQLNAINDISKDMTSSKPMNRLLQGDVGSGKTVVALYAVILSVLNDHQAVFMAPTEILARQHFMTICEFLMPMGMNVKLLISDINEKEKEMLKQDIKEGKVDLIVGTHALLQEDVEFKSMGVVVVDEQHKFGVGQRKTLIEKGNNPDVLYMTATPIPRTLAITIYGDLDISFIKSKLTGRIPVETYWVAEKKRNNVYEFIRSEVDKGRQAYIVYPRIEGDDDSEIKGAVSMYDKISKQVFPELNVALLHGKMSSEEKIKIMKAFKNGEY
ncbi:MAG: ATP-dependent DNA helicase RecG, partial [Candidatus Omnitrophica bacterium]|nr:ATP-dependent DNA helicase RecG [Candidatus Omnitrophota bacterium]